MIEVAEWLPEHLRHPGSAALCLPADDSSWPPAQIRYSAYFSTHYSHTVSTYYCIIPQLSYLSWRILTPYWSVWSYLDKILPTFSCNSVWMSFSFGVNSSWWLTLTLNPSKSASHSMSFSGIDSLRLRLSAAVNSDYIQTVNSACPTLRRLRSALQLPHFHSLF